jgi:hypothetical protein
MRKLAIMVLVAGCGDGRELESTASSVSQALSVNGHPTADAAVRDGTYAKYPRGALPTLEVKTQDVGWNRKSYLRFDLPEIPEPIRTAKLWLYGSYAGSGAPVRAQVRPVGDATWTESTLTWNNAPAIDPDALATALVSGEPRWYSWDVTTHARALQEAAATQIDLALQSDQYGDGLASFASRESSANPPVLSLSTENDNTAPTVAVAAHAWPSAVVTESSTMLRVLGEDDMGEVNLTYTWQALGTPPAPVRFSRVTDRGQNTYAGFAAVGIYDFRVTITDGQGLSVASDVRVEVQLNRRRWQVVIEPQSATVRVGESFQFSATVRDQFYVPLAPQPAVTWSANDFSPPSVSGTVTASGLYTASTTPGNVRLRAASTGVIRSGAATVSIAP